jgi:hypothetical protein
MCITQPLQSEGRVASGKPGLRQFHWFSYSERKHCRNIPTLTEKYNEYIFIGWALDVATEILITA